MFVSVAVVVSIGWVALSIWVMFAILEASAEARRYYQRENRKHDR